MPFAAPLFAGIGAAGTVVGLAQQRKAASAQARAAGLEAAAAEREAEFQAEQYDARAAAADWNLAVNEENRRIALWEAEDIRWQGRRAAARKLGEAGRIKGSQIAQMAASGFLAGGGSAYRILRDTDRLGKEDAEQLLRNAGRAAYARDLEAFSLGAESELLRRDAASDRRAAQATRQSKRALAGIGAARAAAVRRAGNAALFGGFARAAPGLKDAYDAISAYAPAVSWSGAR